MGYVGVCRDERLGKSMVCFRLWGVLGYFVVCFLGIMRDNLFNYLITV